ncbi:hypothetical protein [Streptomyces niveiscabiei]|uniref:Uncharacterized protein n=1 Tax=Streptomyces niveiscabiei TaxID=164115 RepID=A0ABW9HR66_9ACTN
MRGPLAEGNLDAAARLDVGDAQRCAVGRGRELYVAGELLDPDRVPEVSTTFGFPGDAVTPDESAVQDDERQTVAPALFQDPGEAGR